MTLEQMLFGFEGRIRRSHWWVARIALAVGLLGMKAAYVAVKHMLDARPDPINMILVGIAGLLAVGLLIWMTVALDVKRLHDLGWNGWLVVLDFVPLVGAVFSLGCLGVLDGNPTPNRFGPSPKHPDAEAEAFA